MKLHDRELMTAMGLSFWSWIILTHDEHLHNINYHNNEFNCTLEVSINNLKTYVKT
jgi:hypothetical protein